MPRVLAAVPRSHAEHGAAASSFLNFPREHGVQVPSSAMLPISVPDSDIEALLKPLPGGHELVVMGTHEGSEK